MHRVVALALVFAVGLVSTGHAQTQAKKKAAGTTTQQQTPPSAKKNEYGPGCKNQGASIMSGGCVN